MADALRSFIRWMLHAPAGTARVPRSHMRMVGRRMIVMAWMLDPSIFGGKSLNWVARRYQIPHRVSVRLSKHMRRALSGDATF